MTKYSYQAIWKFTYIPSKFEYTSLEQQTITSHPDIDLMKVLTINSNFPVVSYSVATATVYAQNNVLNLHCEFPLGRLVARTGLSVTLSLHCRVSIACFPARVWLARLYSLWNFNLYCRKHNRSTLAI